ncbi:ATP-grasp domain-containing protein [Cryptosporangium arvum]|uniref:ATP-grasp domain-containing protein n=1 Tax=Cryptosporangium arvum TaxID=80871 RepID=UPI0004BC4867|nr:hypothetical protein [Cryptosporangium arvum]
MEMTTRRRIAVLSKKSLADHDYPGWLASADGRPQIVLFAEDSDATRAHLAERPGVYHRHRLFGNWKGNRAVDEAVLAAHAEQPIDSVVALSECDVVRAAQLRDRLGLRGPGPRAARAYRDKLQMKTLARRAGIAVPEFAAVDSVLDLDDFLAAHPAGIVVKPVDGAGAAEVRTVTSRDELDRWARMRNLSGDDTAGLMVEEYVDAPMFCVDGLAREGRVLLAVASRYTRTPLSSLSEVEPLGLLTLDRGSRADLVLQQTARRVVAALPPMNGVHSFHCELFWPRGGQPLLCEIAARTGGGKIRWMVDHVLGVDLEAEAAKGQAGLPWTGAPSSGTGSVAGFVLFPRPGRRLKPLPRVCPVPGVVEVHERVDLSETEERSAAHKSSEYVIDATLTAGTHSELSAVHAGAVTWIQQESAW